MLYQVLDAGRRPVYRAPDRGLIPLVMPTRGDLRARIRAFEARLAWRILLAISGTIRPA